MMKKKLIALLIGICVIAMLTACGSKNSGAEKDSGKAPDAQTSTSEAASDNKDEAGAPDAQPADAADTQANDKQPSDPAQGDKNSDKNSDAEKKDDAGKKDDSDKNSDSDKKDSSDKQENADKYKIIKSGFTGYVKSPVYVRAEPNKDSEIVSAVGEGDEVNVIGSVEEGGKTRGWLQIEYEGQICYIWGENIVGLTDRELQECDKCGEVYFAGEEHVCAAEEAKPAEENTAEEENEPEDAPEVPAEDAPAEETVAEDDGETGAEDSE